MLLALPSVAVEARSPSASFRDDDSAADDLARFRNYLIQINGSKSQSTSLRDDAAAEDDARLQIFLAQVDGGKGRSYKVTQGKDDLLTPPSPPARGAVRVKQAFWG